MGKQALQKPKTYLVAVHQVVGVVLLMTNVRVDRVWVPIVVLPKKMGALIVTIKETVTLVMENFNLSTVNVLQENVQQK